MDLSIAAWRQNGDQLIDADFSSDAEIARSKLGTRTLKHVYPATGGVSDDAGTGKTTDTPGAGVTFPNANAAGYAYQFPIPDHWEEGQDITIDIWWNSTGTSGDAKFTIDYASMEENEAVTSQGTASQTTTVNGSAGYLNKTSITLSASIFKKGDLAGLLVYRDPTDVADTLASDIIVFAVTAKLTARG